MPNVDDNVIDGEGEGESVDADEAVYFDLQAMDLGLCRYLIIVILLVQYRRHVTRETCHVAVMLFSCKL